MDEFTFTLAASAVAIISPFIKKGTEAFASELATEIGEDAAKVTVAKIKSLFDKIKSKFRGDNEAEDAVRHFEEKPDRYSSTVQDILKEKLDEDNDFAMDLDKLVKRPNLNIIIKMAEVKKAKGLTAKKLSSGNANIKMEIDKGEEIVGADIEEIG